MVETNEKVFSEVYAILKMLGNTYINKLPEKVYNLICNSKDENYIPVYMESKSFEEQNIKKQTVAIIALLHLNYWCDTENEKENLKSIIFNNGINLEKELRAKYNPDQIFKNKLKKTEEVTALVEIKQKNIFEKIIDFLRKKFKFKSK